MQNLEAFFKNFAIFCKFFYSVFYLICFFTKKARKLKVFESNPAKTGLTKPWLAADEVNRSPVVRE